MKRRIFAPWPILAVVLVLALAGGATAYFRPELVPDWAHLPPGLADRISGYVPDGEGEGASKEADEPSPAIVTSEHPDDGWCALHHRPEAGCPECPTPTSSGTGGVRTCAHPLPVLQLRSPELADKLGFRTAEAVREVHAHRLEANAETSYDTNRYAEVTPRVTGYFREVRADLGQACRAGDVLAVVDSAEVGAAKGRYLAAASTLRLAKVTYDRTKRLLETRAVAPKAELEDLDALNQAEAALTEAELTLRNLGLDSKAIAAITEDRDALNRIEIKAPIDGVVVERHAVQGEAVQPTSRLFAVADTSTMWLWIRVYEEDVGFVRIGQDVRYQISGAIGGFDSKVYEGEVTWISTEVDPMTRTTRVRASLANPGGGLRANVFGDASIRVGEEHQVVVVPASALQPTGEASVVFLPDGPARYRPQRVVARPSTRAGVVEVDWGLEPGDRVVTDGSFWLATEVNNDLEASK